MGRLALKHHFVIPLAAALSGHTVVLFLQQRGTGRTNNAIDAPLNIIVTIYKIRKQSFHFAGYGQLLKVFILNCHKKERKKTKKNYSLHLERLILS